MSNHMNIALIGDLVASRAMPENDRHELQDRLTAYLDAVHSDASAGIAARPLVTLGDEFQALFSADPAGVRRLLGLITDVLDLARPTSVRFGIGVGRLTTALREQTLGMDGPCFYRAREALQRTRASDLPCQLVFEGCDVEVLWSTLASYALRQRHDWTEPQREAISLFQKLGAWNKVAEALGVSPGAVSLRQQAAGWSIYRTAWSSLERGLIGMIAPTSLDIDREVTP